MPGLSEEEVRQYHEQGWLLKRGVYTAADMAPLIAAISAQLDARVARLVDKGVVAPEHAFAAEPFATRLGKVAHAIKDPQVKMRLVAEMASLNLTRTKYAIDPVHARNPLADTLLRCIRHGPLLACIEQLVGRDIVGSSIFRIRPKIPVDRELDRTMPFSPAHVPWHQDSGYNLPHCDPFLTVTCWVPLVDATVENGCMWVVPYRLREGIIKHYSGSVSRQGEVAGGYIEIAPEDLPKGRRPVPVEMAAGDVLLMHNLTPHASFDNTSPVTRWSMDLRYTAPTTPNNVGEPPESYYNHPGRDPATMACAFTEADFVVRDSRDPAREVRDGAAFAAVRRSYAKDYARLRGAFPRLLPRWRPVRERPRL